MVFAGWGLLLLSWISLVKAAVLLHDLDTRAASSSPVGLRIVENSGICETTKGVYQASGYADIGRNSSLFFWFFESRSANSAAPVSLWLNGGPGSSSMIGLFEENGPCRMASDGKSVTYNPYSWNNVSHMIYLDSPVGVGFSRGTDIVNTTALVARDIYSFFQVLFADVRFAKYKSNPLGIFTESYGGRYGPVLAQYITAQNQARPAGTVNLNLKYLGIGNGLIDTDPQIASYLQYAKTNPYHPLVNDSVIAQYNQSYYAQGGGRDLIVSCNNGGGDQACTNAYGAITKMQSQLVGPYDPYDVRQLTPNPYPVSPAQYLANISSRIGVDPGAKWLNLQSGIFLRFVITGDWIKSTKPALEAVINSSSTTGIRVALWNGDADYLLNYLGYETVVNSLRTIYSTTYKSQTWANYTVRKTTNAGIYKNAGLFSYIRIFKSGHLVPAYTIGNLGVGEAALQMYKQIISNQSLTEL